MSLLEEIQTGAVDSNSDLGALLRKCKVLAARLRSKPLEDWLVWESNGYPRDVQVPDYRIWALDVKGHFSGPFASSLQDAPIPTMCLPEKSKKFYEQYKCVESVAAIEILLKQLKNQTLVVPTGDLAVVLGTKVYKNMNCMHAWAEFPSTHLIELLNTVRNRILDFSLAIWKEFPTAGELTGPDLHIKPDRVTHIFNTTVNSGVVNIMGSVSDSELLLTININDFFSLEQVLRKSGIEEKEVQELKLAVSADGKPKMKGCFGPKVSSWIEKMKQKAADGSWNIGVGAAGNMLADAISKYFGVG